MIENGTQRGTQKVQVQEMQKNIRIKKVKYSDEFKIDAITGVMGNNICRWFCGFRLSEKRPDHTLFTIARRG